jgi:hypothetical protein
MSAAELSATELKRAIFTTVSMQQPDLSIRDTVRFPTLNWWVVFALIFQETSPVLSTGIRWIMRRVDGGAVNLKAYDLKSGCFKETLDSLSPTCLSVWRHSASSSRRGTRGF